MLSYQAFSPERALTKNGPHTVYGIFGDGHLQKQVIAALLEWSVDASARDFNLDQLDGETCSIPDVIGACGNLPFLSDRRAVVVRRAEKMEGLGKSEAGEDKKAKKGGLSPAKKLTEAIWNLPGSTVLILAHTPETLEPGARPGTSRCINAAVDKEIDKAGLLIDCTIDPRNSTMVAGIIQAEAARRGIALAPRTAGHMVERCGNDVAALLTELEKCALRAGPGQPITPAIVDEMSRRRPQETVFDLTDAIGERRGARALQLLRELIDEGEPPELLLNLIVRQLRQLLQARAFLDANLSLDANLARRLPPQLAAQLPSDGRENVANLLQTQSWLGRRLAAQARNFTTPQLMAALEAAFAADLAMKGIEGDGGFASNKESTVAMELFVTRLCA